MTYSEAVNAILTEVQDSLMDIIDGWKDAAEDTRCEGDRLIYLARAEYLIEAQRVVYGNQEALNKVKEG